MCPICGKQDEKKKRQKAKSIFIQNQELLRLRLTHEEKVFYTELYYDNAVSGKVTRNNFLPLLGMLGTQIAEEFADRIFMAFSSNKEDITLCEYLRYIDIYHYGDDRERCRVTCKLIDKQSKGFITFEDFNSYITLIMNAVKKVNGGQGNVLLSDTEVKDLFFHISKDKDKFTYQDFEDVYKEKPELVSWFDYFKNNKEDLLLVIDENVKLLLDKINGFLSYFMEDLFKVLDNEEEIDLEAIIQKVFDYSKEFEILRQSFLQKISAFNIRSTFDKLQHNNKDEKTNDLINALQKKIFSNENNNNNINNNISSYNDTGEINANIDLKALNQENKDSTDPIPISSQNSGGRFHNNQNSISSRINSKFFSTKNRHKLSVPENNFKKKSVDLSAHTASNKHIENRNMDKFFEDIKNKINFVKTEASHSRKTINIYRFKNSGVDSKLSINYGDLSNNNTNNVIVNSSSDIEKEKNISQNVMKDSKSIKVSAEGSRISINSSSRISAINGNKFLNIKSIEYDFMKHFIKQKAIFDNKMIRFGSERGSKIYSELDDPTIKLKALIPIKTVKISYEINDNNTIKDEIEENDDEEENDDQDYIKAKSTIKYLRKSSQFQNHPCKRVLSYYFIENSGPPKKVITSEMKNNNMTFTIRDLDLRARSTQLLKETNIQNLIDEEGNSLIYDKSDYEKTIINDDIDCNLYDPKDPVRIIKKNKFSSDSLIRSNQSDFKINAQYKVVHTSKKVSNSKIIFANEEKPKRTKSKFLINKYIKKINVLEKESHGLKQLLFCSRVVLENANDICQTFLRCYKWIGENYLESQIKKVQKEIRLKEKQKKDKEKYGKMGNLPKKENQAKKKILRTSDQSFKLLLNMIMGIQIAVQSVPNFHLKLTEDLNKYLTNMLYSIQTINFGRKNEEVFVLKEFAGIIFNNIRLYLGYDKDDFISSISPQDFITELMISNQTIFEELCSTGKSGSLFYYTRDGQFIVKTIKKQEYKFLKQILQDYFKHLKQNPLSLLPKFLGCYVLIRKVKKKRSKIYFIVMVNVFATSKRIHIRYDLKGSRVGRRVLTGNKTDDEILEKGDLALKDLDFEKLNQKVFVGEKREIILKQIKKDADFLCKIGANDYSLLLGIHDLNKEKNANLNNEFENSNNVGNSNEGTLNIMEQNSADSILSNKSANERLKKLENVIDFDDGGIISETGEEIYFLGIIDILTKYNWMKKVEHFSKMIRYCSNEMSCTPPNQYRDRFVRYMDGVIQKKNNLILKCKNSTKNIINNLNNINNINCMNNSSNIILQNNTSNIFHIVNNNNTITLNQVEDKNEIDTNYKLKTDKIALTSKYNTEDIIKEESIDTGQDNEKIISMKSNEIKVE